jgi:hypothetical protein
MRWGGGLAAFLVLLCAGCMGSSGEAQPSTSTEPQPPTSQPTSTESALPDPGGWATAAELHWLEQYGHWASRINRAREDVVTAAADLLGGGGEEATRELERLLAPMRTCGDNFRELVPASPTARLHEIADLTEAACERYTRGVDQLVTAARARSEDAMREATAELRHAGSSFVLANGKLPPGGVQPLPVIDAPASRSHVNTRYGRAAGTVVGQRVEARCWSRDGWRRLLREASLVTGTRFPVGDTGGFTMIGSGRINLAPIVCDLLDDLTYGRLRPRGRTGQLSMSFALDILAHESYHRAGVIDEAVAECYGMQRIAVAAEALDVPSSYARRMARLAWETYGLLPAGYRSRECRDGGELDLDPAVRGPWDY